MTHRQTILSTSLQFFLFLSQLTSRSPTCRRLLFGTVAGGPGETNLKLSHAIVVALRLPQAHLSVDAHHLLTSGSISSSSWTRPRETLYPVSTSPSPTVSSAAPSGLPGRGSPCDDDGGDSVPYPVLDPPLPTSRLSIISFIKFGHF